MLSSHGCRFHWPQGRLEEIAKAALFLTSSDSRFITGIELN
jgi:hypothetical protein